MLLFDHNQTLILILGFIIENRVTHSHNFLEITRCLSHVYTIISRDQYDVSVIEQHNGLIHTRTFNLYRVMRFVLNSICGTFDKPA